LQGDAIGAAARADLRAPSPGQILAQARIVASEFGGDLLEPTLLVGVQADRG
jgi:hypothetical protein